MTTPRSLPTRRALAVALLSGALAAGALPARVLAADTAEAPVAVAPRIAALLGESSLDHQIEDLASKLREATEYERYTSTYGTTAAQRERLRVFRRMMDEANIAERMTGLVTDMQMATIYGAMAVAPPELHAGVEAMIARIDAQRPAVGSMMETVLPLHLAWVMDGFTEAELGELLVIGRRPEQQRLLDGWMGGVREAFVGAMAEFLPRLAEAERFAETRTEI